MPHVELVQTLWNGYGELLRCRLKGGHRPAVIVKHVRWPTAAQHPRGWNSNRSHERKVRSYEIERHWYQQYADACGDPCRVPQHLAASSLNGELFLVLEDLDLAGFASRRTSVSDVELDACLSWLAPLSRHLHGPVAKRTVAGRHLLAPRHPVPTSSQLWRTAPSSNARRTSMRP